MQNGESLRRWLGKPVREQRGLERARHDHLQHFVIDLLWYHIDHDRGARFRRLHDAATRFDRRFLFFRSAVTCGGSCHRHLQITLTDYPQQKAGRDDSRDPRRLS